MPLAFGNMLKTPVCYVPPCNMQSKLDSVVMALLAISAPALMYLAIHAAVLGHWLHLWSLMLLVSVPLLFVATLPQGLWWLPGGLIVQTGLRRVLIMLGGLGLIAGGEGVSGC